MAQDKGLKFLRIRKVVTLAELALHLHCSPRTVQRRLADWAGINSYYVVFGIDYIAATC
jgi:AraC-like DNA-binding protein